MKKLTEQEKAIKKRRDNLEIIHNQILSAWSFKKLSTFNDLLKVQGLPIGEQDHPLTYEELKTYLRSQKENLEKDIESKGKGQTNTNRIQQVITSEVKDNIQRPRSIRLSAPTQSGDFNACAVITIAHLLNKPYEEIQHALLQEGRNIGKGIREDYLSEFLRSVGFEPQEGLIETLDKVVQRLHGNDKYLLTTKDHCFAFENGTVLDCNEPKWNAIILRIYKFTGVIHKEVDVEVVHNEDDDYGWKPSPNQSPDFSPYWFQKKAVAEMIRKVDEGKRGLLLISITGSGKTIMSGMLLRYWLDNGYHEDKTFASNPYIYVTKATIVEQAGDDFKKNFNIKPNVDVEVFNIEMLRSKDGQLYLKREVYIENGVEKERWVWKKKIQPAAFLLDESQGVKNPSADQSQIVYSYNDLAATEDTLLLSISATPFGKVSEAQGFAVSTRRPLEHLGFPKGTVLTNANWKTYAQIIASPSKPDEYNEAAVGRLVDDLKDYIIRVKGIKSQFKAINGVKIIDFETSEKKQRYQEAEQRFLEEKEKLDRQKLILGEEVKQVCYLVILLKYQMAAEYEHADHFAADMDRAVRNGKAAVAAVKFKPTLIRIVELLITKYGWKRSDISLIWGGGQTAQTKKQKDKAKIEKMKEKLEAAGVSVEEMLKTLELDDVQDRKILELPDEWDLGPQTLDKRNKEKLAFNSGKRLFCIYTLKAGGVGLDLPHSDKYTTDWNRNHPDFAEWYSRVEPLVKAGKLKPGKCRRKESGYVYEEDIKFIPVRERETSVVVTYNAIELAQSVGRVPRINSLSHTVQNVYCYLGTIEVAMGRVYSQKLRCIGVATKLREDWTPIIFGHGTRNKIVEDVIKKTEGMEDDSDLIDTSGGEDEEDDDV